MPCVAVKLHNDDRILRLTIKGIKYINNGNGCTPYKLLRWLKKFTACADDPDLIEKVVDALKKALYIEVIEKRNDGKYHMKDTVKKPINVCPLPYPPKRARTKPCTKSCACSKAKLNPSPSKLRSSTRLKQKQRLKTRPCPLPFGNKPKKSKSQLCIKPSTSKTTPQKTSKKVKSQCSCDKCTKKQNPKDGGCKCKEGEDCKAKEKDLKTRSSIAGHSIPSSVHSSIQSGCSRCKD